MNPTAIACKANDHDPFRRWKFAGNPLAQNQLPLLRLPMRRQKEENAKPAGRAIPENQMKKLTWRVRIRAFV